MIAMIKNANQRRHPKLGVPHSRLKEGVAQVLKAEGYLSDVKVVADEKRAFRKTMWLYLKYDTDNRRVLTDIKRVSKPGRRIYAKKERLPRVLGGMGTAVISTSGGLITSKRAQELGVGGEVVCFVW